MSLLILLGMVLFFLVVDSVGSVVVALSLGDGVDGVDVAVGCGVGVDIDVGVTAHSDSVITVDVFIGCCY